MRLKVLAAGSLRQTWQPLMDYFQHQTSIQVETQFGPAGMLRKRIENGEKCCLFASANMAHPQALQAQGLALSVARFIGNRLCLTVAEQYVDENADWLSLIANPALRLATSTQGSDPSGDYTWLLFDKLEQEFGLLLQKRAMPLVGGPDCHAIPKTAFAASWLITQNRADMFIGYASYAHRLRLQKGICVLDIPNQFNILADYGIALCNSEAQSLTAFLCSEPARNILIQHGFEE